MRALLDCEEAACQLPLEAFRPVGSPTVGEAQGGFARSHAISCPGRQVAIQTAAVDQCERYLFLGRSSRPLGEMSETIDQKSLVCHQLTLPRHRNSCSRVQ